jgi:hypothetical protein
MATSDPVRRAGHASSMAFVHDLENEMVQAAGGGGADIHARPQPHGLQPLQNLDLAGVVCLCGDFISLGHSFIPHSNCSVSARFAKVAAFG